MKRRIRWTLFVGVLVVQIAMLRVSVRADDHFCLARQSSGCTAGLPTFQYQLLLSEMVAHPTPDVRPLEIAESELGRSTFNRVVGGAAALYDAPNGKPVDVLDFDFGNFRYVGVRSQQGDWVEVMRGRWMRANMISRSNASTFAGVLINEPLSYPMAWVLLPTAPSAIPGAKPDPAIPLLERYTRVNIFAIVKVGDWEWYLVGPDQWLEQRRVARVRTTPRPDGVKGRWIAVDLYEQVLAAYEEEKMIFATLISSGVPKPGFGTNKGLFRIWARPRFQRMTGGMGGPDYYNLPAVPYIMYYDDAISLHGTYWHDGFGYRRSHGCVNMSITDARWLYEWTSGFYTDAWVYVYASRQGIKSG